MTDIIELIIVIIFLWVLFSFIGFASKRIYLLIKLSELCKYCKASFSLQSFILRPMWLCPEKADIVLEILDTVYHIRLYSGGGIANNVHFANEEYSAVYMKVKGASRSVRAATANTLALSSGLNIFSKVYYHKPLSVQKIDGKRVVRVLLLNPAPAGLSYVTEEKNSIRIAFTGDEMYGMKVFTASTFVAYCERQYREELRQREEAKRSPTYYYDDFNSFN